MKLLQSGFNQMSGLKNTFIIVKCLEMQVLTLLRCYDRKTYSNAGLEYTMKLGAFSNQSHLLNTITGTGKYFYILLWGLFTKDE